jgi:hypothetical protein
MRGYLADEGKDEGLFANWVHWHESWDERLPVSHGPPPRFLSTVTSIPLLRKTHRHRRYSRERPVAGPDYRSTARECGRDQL